MARTCKYGNLKTPVRKGGKVRRCKRKRKGKKCSKKVCKFGKYKTPRKTRKGTRCCKRKPHVPESMKNSISKKISLVRKSKSLSKQLAKASADASAESDPVKKLTKQMKAAKLTKELTKVGNSQAKVEASLSKKITEYKAKGALQSKLADIEISKMNKKIASL